MRFFFVNPLLYKFPNLGNLLRIQKYNGYLCNS